MLKSDRKIMVISLMLNKIKKVIFFLFKNITFYLKTWLITSTIKIVF
jgi:hypothetical protein